MKKEEFINACQQAGISIDQKQIKQFETYLHLLQEWNEKMNLTSIIEEEEIWEKHFYDSILPFKNCKKGFLCDVGSGAGFPGIILAINYPSSTFYLVEPILKRCKFLEIVKSELNLDNVIIVNKRAEDLKNDKEYYNFDVIVSRAVSDLRILLELSIPFLKLKGILIAYKGKDVQEEIDLSLNALKTLNSHIEKIQHDYLSIKEYERNNLIIMKDNEIDSKYPRRFNEIKKKPL